MKDISGGEVVARMLQIEGVDTVFGIVDGTYLGLCSALRSLGISLITPRHETNAAHMAGAYARLTGKLGVCIASNGPGVANILPGLVVEQAEGNRVLCLTSARRTGIVYPERPGGYQSFDQSGVIGRIGKWSRPVTSFARIPETLRAALRQCWEGRPGVVHVDIPEDVANTKVKSDVAFWQPSQYRRMQPIEPPAVQVAESADILINAERPAIHVGSGVIHAGAYAELARVAELLQAPVTTSWSARSAMDERSPLAVPMIHVKLNTTVRTDADAVLVLGSRLGETDWWGKAPYWRRPDSQKCVQVDIDPQILGAHKPADVAVQADVRLFLERLAVALEARRGAIRTDARRRRIADYAQRRDKERRELDRALADTSVPMNSAHVAATCREVFPDDAVLVADGGNAAVWANFYWQSRSPNTLHSTFKFGMLGAGLGQALGAAVARPGTPVCCIIGDGAFGFHPQEIETAVRHRLPVVFVVMCDRQWGMVKINQSFAMRPLKTLLKKSLDPGENIGTDLGEIQFDKLAEAMGAHGERVADPKDLKAALQRCLAAGVCSVIHVDVHPVKHMWAPGLIHFKAMHQEPKG